MASFTTETRRARRDSIFRLLIPAIALISVTTLFFVADVRSSFARSTIQDPESDSVILARHMHEVKVEYALEEFSDHSFNAGFTEEELDSLMTLEHTSIHDAKMYYSPDSAFKIAVIEMEGCGAYCNPFWESWLHFNDESDLVVGNLNFARIQQIERMSDGKYLVIDQMGGRSGVRVEITLRATLISIDNHQYKTYSIPKIPSQEMKYDSALFISQSAFIDTSQFIRYDNSSEQLNYQYTNEDLGGYSDSDSLMMYNGYFHYDKGAFIFGEEKSSRFFDNNH